MVYVRQQARREITQLCAVLTKLVECSNIVTFARRAVSDLQHHKSHGKHENIRKDCSVT